MATIKSNFSKKNTGELVALAKIVIKNLAPEAPEPPPFPGMEAKVANLQTARDEAEAAQAAYVSAKVTLATLKLIRDEKTRALRMAHTACVRAVESEAAGDASAQLSAGYSLAPEPVRTRKRPEQVQELALSVGQKEGSLKGSNKPTPRARTYEVQVTEGHPTDGPYETKLFTTSSSWMLHDLPSGRRVWVRMRAIGTNGPGPWSDPAVKVVP